MDAENEDNYRFLVQRLKERGLRSVWLVVSDAHLGLKNPIQKEFLVSSWQRCKVHFMRNVLAKVRAKHKEHVAARIKHIWLQTDAGTAREYAKQVMEDLESQFPEAVEILDNGLEDSLVITGAKLQEITGLKLQTPA